MDEMTEKYYITMALYCMEYDLDEMAKFYINMLYEKQ